MPKYLFQASYTRKGVKGLLKDGGSKRAKVVDGLVTSAGGTLEAYYFAFGDNDVYCIAEFPDEAAAAAVSLAVSAKGALTVKTTVLIEPATMDAAVKKSVSLHEAGREEERQLHEAGREEERQLHEAGRIAPHPVERVRLGDPSEHQRLHMGHSGTTSCAMSMSAASTATSSCP